MNNPFVAEPEDDTTAITGIGLLEAGQAALDGINNGDWVEAGLGVVGAGLEALGVYMDPVGTLASYGVGWLIEHVQPLQDMLNDLAGTPPVIRSYAQTWQNISEGVERAAGDLETTSRDRTAGWRGAAGDAVSGVCRRSGRRRCVVRRGCAAVWAPWSRSWVRSRRRCGSSCAT